MKYQSERFGLTRPNKRNKACGNPRWLATVIMVLFSIQLFALTYAQTISLHVKEKTLIEVMKSIQRQTGHTYFLNGKDLADVTVTAEINQADLTATMATILNGKDAT